MTPAVPALLAPDNFTPASRTPWGGSRIAKLKGRSPDGQEDDIVIGESWELSVEPSFPGYLEDGRRLVDVVAEDVVSWLGARAASVELLVKLVDARDDLSVQIHPDDAYANLSAGECGKPESWYVVAREPGARLYLGLAEGVGPEDLGRALEAQRDVSSFFHPVPVEPGDFFVVTPGTPHAIGRGIFVVEPQRVRAGMRGITYRYYDWNRRYDASGRPSAEGELRALHVEHALAVTRFDARRGDALLEATRFRAPSYSSEDPATLLPLAGPSGPLASSDLEVHRLTGTGTLPSLTGRFRGLTVLGGMVTVGDAVVTAGRTAAIPAAFRGELRCAGAHALLSCVPTP